MACSARGRLGQKSESQKYHLRGSLQPVHPCEPHNILCKVPGFFEIKDSRQFLDIRSFPSCL